MQLTNGGIIMNNKKLQPKDLINVSGLVGRIFHMKNGTIQAEYTEDQLRS